MKLYNSIKKWSNENAGFLSVLFFVVGFLYTILQSSISSIIEGSSGFFTLLVDILSVQIIIPLYLLLPFTLPLLVVLFKSIDWLYLKKSTQNKIFNIVSDQNVEFVESISFPNIKKNCPAFVFKDRHHWNNHANEYEELVGSYWVCHTHTITNEEAIKGGNYQFKSSFLLPFKVGKVQKAFLNIIIDDECVLVINEKKMPVLKDYNQLHSVDIIDYLKNGENEVLFNVLNNTASGLSVASHPDFNHPVKGELNPYGFRFKIEIIKK